MNNLFLATKWKGLAEQYFVMQVGVFAVSLQMAYYHMFWFLPLALVFIWSARRNEIECRIKHAYYNAMELQETPK